MPFTGHILGQNAQIASPILGPGLSVLSLFSMGLRYDFDIFTILPDEVFENEKLLETLRESGIRQSETNNKVALFRDVKTADALRRASPGIRRLFVNSGFGLNTYDSGAPDGFYPAEDEAARNRIIRQFIQNMKETPLKGEYCGEFDISEFLSYILSARPLPATDSRRRSRDPLEIEADHAHSAHRVAIYRIGFAVGLAVLAFAAIKLVEALF